MGCSKVFILVRGILFLGGALVALMFAIADNSIEYLVIAIFGALFAFGSFKRYQSLTKMEEVVDQYQHIQKEHHNHQP